jgi:hypothetical protein
MSQVTPSPHPAVERAVATLPIAHNGVFDDFGAATGLRSCPVHVVQATELLALDVFSSGGRQITLGDVECYIHGLRSHSPQCRCGRCAAAAIVRPDRVLMIVRARQQQLRATKVRALR